MRRVAAELQTIPGVGPKIAAQLEDLGIRSITGLGRRNPEVLYRQLCDLRRRRMDACVLYVFRCAVYYASNRDHDPELLKWWNWKGRAE